MSLSRKYLEALGIDEETQTKIIEAHTAVIDEIKKERDNLKKERDDLNNKIADKDKMIDEEKSKYDEKVKEFDLYKQTETAKSIKASKEKAVKDVLKEIGISEKSIDKIVKVTNLDDIKLTDGVIENADSLKESLKTEWEPFIVKTHVEGSDKVTPPGNEGSGEKQLSRAAQLTAKYRNEHYGNLKEE